MEKIKLENLTVQGSYDLEFILCPLCKKKDFKTLLLEQKIPIVRCLNCGLVFANPRPDRNGLLEFYKNYFPPESAPLWQKQMAGIFFEEGLMAIEAFKQSGLLSFSINPKILDIGSGMGFFLDLMKSKGWQTRGIEPSPEAARHAKEVLHLDIFLGTVEEAPIKDKNFDVVTLWYVLEHVPNPHEILNYACSFLKPGGLLIVRVPNQNAPIDCCLDRLGLQKFFLINPPRHLFDYSPRTISKLLEKSGFNVLSIRNGIPRKTGTLLELMRRYLWYGFFEMLFKVTGGKVIRGSSITVYATKK